MSDTDRSACNICGVQWPRHADACAYLVTARTAQSAVKALKRIAGYPLGDPLTGREANKIARAALGRDPSPTEDSHE